MRKKKPEVVSPESVKPLPPELPPMIPPEHKIPTDIRILQSINEIDDRNTESQRIQDRKNLIFFIIGTLIALYSVYLTYKSNEANKTIEELTNHVDSITVKLHEATRQVSELDQKLNLSLRKNDSMRTTVEEMKTVLQKNGVNIE
ncbi:MAG: hypothetical protein H6569_05975 [Lewinellaceae bacterium]|nr:hypothetical protein [Lewinellaceae bacterium]